MVLLSGPIFEIRDLDGIARCAIENRQEVTAEEGARCAEEMHTFLAREVLSASSRYLGLIFDVRKGPAVFGPKTRAALEELFRAAQRASKPIAVCVGDTAIQRLQFSALCKECAPALARVIETGNGSDWVRTRAGSGRQ